MSQSTPKPPEAVHERAGEPRFASKPPWLKVRAPGGETYQHLKDTFRALDLFTVCEEARCPNVGECWREGTATVMLLGETCTRHCRFCAVTTGDPRGAVDVREPEHVARAIARLSLQYVVMTMVNRDDLLDGGAEHVARTVTRLRALRSDILIETLVGDFQGHASSIDTVVDAGPDVFAHNVEVVRRLTRSIRDVRASYDQSLEVLERARTRIGAMDGGDRTAAAVGRRVTKSSIMVGIGETDAEVEEAMRDLRSAGVDVLTIGQYLRPTPKHHEVVRFVHPDVFAEYQRIGQQLGFLYVASGPLVRSSYRAAEVFLRSFRAEASVSLEQRLATARVEAARVAAELDRGDERPSATTTALVPPESLVRR